MRVSTENKIHKLAFNFKIFFNILAYFLCCQSNIYNYIYKKRWQRYNHSKNQQGKIYFNYLYIFVKKLGFIYKNLMCVLLYIYITVKGMLFLLAMGPFHLCVFNLWLWYICWKRENSYNYKSIVVWKLRRKLLTYLYIFFLMVLTKHIYNITCVLQNKKDIMCIFFNLVYKHT